LKRIKIGLVLALWGLAYVAVKLGQVAATVAGWVWRQVRRPWLRKVLWMGLGVVLLVGLGWSGVSWHRSAVCADNLRQIYQALRLYEADTGFLPPRLGDLHPTYLPYNSPVLMCPAFDGYMSWIMTGTRTNYMYACSYRHRRVPKGTENDPRSQRALAYDKKKKQYKEPLFFKMSDFSPDFVLILCSGGHWDQQGGYNHLRIDGSVFWSRSHKLVRPDARLGLDRANTGREKSVREQTNYGIPEP